MSDHWIQVILHTLGFLVMAGAAWVGIILGSIVTRSRKPGVGSGIWVLICLTLIVGGLLGAILTLVQA